MTLLSRDAGLESASSDSTNRAPGRCRPWSQFGVLAGLRVHLLIGLHRTKSCTDLCAAIARRWYRSWHHASSLGVGAADEHLLTEAADDENVVVFHGSSLRVTSTAEGGGI